MSQEKDHFRFWNVRKYIALLAIVGSGLTVNSFNTALIGMWLLIVVAPVVILFLTSNDGDETQVLLDKLKEWIWWND